MSSCKGASKRKIVNVKEEKRAEDEIEEDEEMKTEEKAKNALKEEKSAPPVSDSVDSIVFPGDVITLKANMKARLGIGLMQNKDTVVALKCGLLRQTGGNKLWIDNVQKRYIPAVEDMVVGVVIEKHTENYKVDIGGPQSALLPSLAFEGASKRNRPNIAIGALVYCRVVMANKDMEPELSCTSPHMKKDWVTGESMFGELAGGYCFKCSLSLARRLLEDEEAPVLKYLAKKIPFELAIGTNGIIWVNSGSPWGTVVISNAILNSEHLKDELVAVMVEKLIDSIPSDLPSSSSSSSSDSSSSSSSSPSTSSS
eukprot:TRINITY_DN270_c0_g1_i1.p1 TRINITY_DN270_c0_g1~~TRINITY_DN270_c0_g1_i1.p1  ORF type:complete len:312 (+),score=100.98 TRINITY_DN270_c0_g1_i1:85-1020(+)